MPSVKKINCALRLAGRRNPELLMKRFEALGFSELELVIMKLRYIDGLLFKQIVDQIPVGERRMFNLHKSALQKTVDGAIAEFMQVFGCSKSAVERHYIG